MDNLGSIFYRNLKFAREITKIKRFLLGRHTNRKQIDMYTFESNQQEKGKKTIIAES